MTRKIKTDRTLGEEDRLKEDKFLKITQIVGDRRADPPIPPIIPVSRSGWWAGVKSGRYPKPIKLGPKTTVWRASEIYRLFDQ